MRNKEGEIGRQMGGLVDEWTDWLTHTHTHVCTHTCMHTQNLNTIRRHIRGGKDKSRKKKKKIERNRERQPHMDRGQL